MLIGSAQKVSAASTACGELEERDCSRGFRWCTLQIHTEPAAVYLYIVDGILAIAVTGK